MIPLHDKTLRAPWHDYRLRGTYLITIVVRGREPILGRLLDNATIARSPLGETIAREEIGKMMRYYPQVRIVDFIIMPDHIHIIIRLIDDLPPGKTLGTIIKGFKQGCNRAYNLRLGRERGNYLPLFKPKYNDEILMDDGVLDRWEHYIADNPRRLTEKRAHPDLFRVVHNQLVAGIPCEVIGNKFLLDIPDKPAIIVHRCYTDEQRQAIAQHWLAAGEGGAVLTSAGIAPDEKAILNEAYHRHYRVIMLCQYGFGPYFKPQGKTFDACAEGRLLMVSPWPPSTKKKTITRQQCLQLNAIAQALHDHQTLSTTAWAQVGAQ